MPGKVARLLLLPLTLGAGLIPPGGGAARAETPPIEIRFQNHCFVPQNLTVPAGQAVVIKVVNESQETIEFESFKLNRERALPPGEAITVHLTALSPGSYDFYDDFHQDVPQGTITAK